jgi:hypothetical protein
MFAVSAFWNFQNDSSKCFIIIGNLSKVLTTTFSAASHIFSTFASDKPLMLHKLYTNKLDLQCATFCQGRIITMRSELAQQ